MFVDLLVQERKYSLEDHKWRPLNDFSGLDSLAGYIIVVWKGHVFSFSKLLECLFKKVPVKDLRVVEVYGSYVSHLFRGTLFVEAILRDGATFFVLADSDALEDFLSDCCLTTSSSACDTNKDRSCFRSYVIRFLIVEYLALV